MKDATSQPLYPLLQHLLYTKGLELQPIYTIRDAAKLFGVCPRTLQSWVRQRKLRVRDLPGRGRFLPVDLEEFLHNSHKRNGDDDEPVTLSV